MSPNPIKKVELFLNILPLKDTLRVLLLKIMAKDSFPPLFSLQDSLLTYINHHLPFSNLPSSSPKKNPSFGFWIRIWISMTIHIDRHSDHNGSWLSYTHFSSYEFSFEFSFGKIASTLCFEMLWLHRFTDFWIISSWSFSFCYVGLSDLG